MLMWSNTVRAMPSLIYHPHRNTVGYDSCHRLAWPQSLGALQRTVLGRPNGYPPVFINLTFDLSRAATFRRFAATKCHCLWTAYFVVTGGRYWALGSAEELANRLFDLRAHG